jgi:homoserine O-acetyltransferase/O-succinyltransferase
MLNAERALVDLPEPLALDCGRVLRDVSIAYESYGRDDAPGVILVCHALTGDAHAAGVTPGVASAGEVEATALGWWDMMIGPGRAFDTERHRVLCTNLVGGCRGSTGPGSIDPETAREYGSTFPRLTVADLVRAQHAFLEALGIESLLAVTGASLGGMQALQFALDYPELVRSVIAIAATARLDAQGVALNAIARKAITSDPAWQGGDYYGTGRTPRDGLGIARRIGHVTYLSKESLRAKARDGRLSIEEYLDHQAARFVDRFDANTYLLFSDALTRFELSDAELASIRAPVLLLSFDSDWIYPSADSETLAAALPNAEHVVLQTAYGHDAFLVEGDLQTPHIRQFLDRVQERK